MNLSQCLGLSKPLWHSTTEKWYGKHLRNPSEQLWAIRAFLRFLCRTVDESWWWISLCPLSHPEDWCVQPSPFQRCIFNIQILFYKMFKWKCWACKTKVKKIWMLLYMILYQFYWFMFSNSLPKGHKDEHCLVFQCYSHRINSIFSFSKD